MPKETETETERERGERSAKNSVLTPLFSYIVPFSVLFVGVLGFWVRMPGQSPFSLQDSDKQPLFNTAWDPVRLKRPDTVCLEKTDRGAKKGLTLTHGYLSSSLPPSHSLSTGVRSSRLTGVRRQPSRFPQQVFSSSSYFIFIFEVYACQLCSHVIVGLFIEYQCSLPL